VKIKQLRGDPWLFFIVFKQKAGIISWESAKIDKEIQEPHWIGGFVKIAVEI
jgi:hypothetical protein